MKQQVSLGRPRSIGGWVAWQLGVMIILLTLVSARFGSSVWDMGAVHLPITRALMGGYLIASLALMVERPSHGHLRALGPVTRSAAVGFGLAGLWLVISGAQASRMILVMGVGLGVGFLWLRQMLPTPWRPRAGAALLPLSLLAATLAANVTLAPPARSAVNSTLTETAYHSLRTTFHDRVLPGSASRLTGGGIADAGDFQVLGTADGTLLEVQWDSAGPRISTLPVRIPFDRSGLIRATSLGAFTQWFRVMDIELTADGDLMASYHHWIEEDGCFVLRVSLLRELERIRSGAAEPVWETVYDTAPCLEPFYDHPGWPFRGQEGGGRMAAVGDSLYLTVGDHGFNGVDFPIDLVQDPSSDYGKTLLLDWSTGERQIASVGHRNTQGLLVDGPNIWLTEHGPEGGDELNLLRFGANYGWPLVTYGTDYGQPIWPLGDEPDRHEGFEQPAMAWVPSVGISNLVRITGTKFERWRGDLLIASMRGGQLLRVRLTEDQRVVSVEPISVDRRIRDLVELRDGRILLLLDDYSLAEIDVADSPFSGCAGCHRGSVEDRSAIGPPLAGVVGRDIASVPGFSYSEALQRAGGRWTEEALDEFLAGPLDFRHGSAMLSPGITDPERRAEIIQYLSSLR